MRRGPSGSRPRWACTTSTIPRRCTRGTDATSATQSCRAGPFATNTRSCSPHLARIAHSERIANACTVDVNGAPVRLYGVHAALPFTVSGSGRREQMQAIIDDAKAGPERVIVAGDLNSYGLGER